jgi:hypothetical protein
MLHGLRHLLQIHRCHTRNELHPGMPGQMLQQPVRQFGCLPPIPSVQGLYGCLIDRPRIKRTFHLILAINHVIHPPLPHDTNPQV